MAAAKRKEVSTSDMELGQSAPIILPEEGQEIVRGETILPVDSPEGMEYADSLAFMEEPVTIRIEPTADKNASKVIECWVNGVGAEVLDGQRWVRLGFLPVGVPVTTRRKYVEVLARAKTETFTNNVHEMPGQDPVNQIQRFNSSRAPFSVIHDANPKGGEWLSKLLARTW